jgi:periplasmic copper chaperone A
VTSTDLSEPLPVAVARPGRGRLVVPIVLLGLAVVIGVFLVLPDPGAGPPRLSVTAAAASPGRIGDMVSVYVVVANAGGPDTVVSASSDAGAAVTLHATAAAEDGSFMVDLERLKVPARGTLTLAPGGRHLMLHHLFAPLDPGDVIAVTIVFERSGPVVVQVPVRSFTDLATFGTPA